MSTVISRIFMRYEKNVALTTAICLCIIISHAPISNKEPYNKTVKTK